jgi:HAD superfamily hydrolase (TIGR01490 family)
LDSGAVLRAWDAYRFLAEPGSAKRTQRLRAKFDDRDVVGTEPGGFAAEPRGVRSVEVRVLLLSRTAIAAAAASGCMVRCEFAAVAFGRRASFGNGHGRILRGSRDSCDLGWTPVFDECQHYWDSSGLYQSGAMNARQKIGAFFDLDGTLLAPPSLEWRFIGYLMERDEIRTVNLARWIARSVRTFLSNGHRAVLANKYYLAGIRESVVAKWEKTIAPGSLPLLIEGIKRMRWHLESGHRVVLITGTLAPLARAMARHLPRDVEIRATELEMENGRFSGRLSGAHLSFDEKERVMREEAARSDLSLSKSFAYGNEMSDAAMLEAVGRAAAVNASWRLGGKARGRGWTVLRWSGSHEEKERPLDATLAPREVR